VKRLLSLATLYPNAHRPRFGPFVARQMEALAARGDWDVTVLNPIGVPPLALGRYMSRYRALAEAAVTGVEHGVTVHRPRFTLVPAVGGPINPRMIARAALPLARRLHALAPFDLVDAQFFYPDGPAAARIAAALGLPLSVKARGADIHMWGGKAYGLRQMLKAADQAAGLLTVSEALAGDMAERGFPRGKITVHYTGLDRALFRPLDRPQSRALLAGSFGISTEGPLLATVGALIPRKGQQLVIRALARLPEAHLALVGTGPDQAALETLAREGGIGERVHFLGSLDHERLPAVLSAADAMVLPSASEGLANAWVEALACGCPLVIADAGGARELVKGREAGRIVARDPEAIAAAVRELLAAPPAREAVAECAARFSWEANAAELAAYYEGLLKPKWVE
jgi:teichuronic acid biosynthesis glycosyltransferase TuaC